MAPPTPPFSTNLNPPLMSPPQLRETHLKKSLTDPTFSLGTFVEHLACMKMRLPFFFRTSKDDGGGASSSWPPWAPSCRRPGTLSFRSGDVFKTINSAYSDTDSEESAPEEYAGAGEVTEAEIRGMRSERLFFDPGESSSILESAAESDKTASFFKRSVLMSVDSRDPFADFRRSMEEMVEAHRLKDLDGLDELLRCYLKVNGKHNHGYIVGAFVDLLVDLAINTDYSNRHSRVSPVSPLSFDYTSSGSSSSSSTAINTPSEKKMVARFDYCYR